MSDQDRIGVGRAALDIAQQGLEEALTLWRSAKEEEKGARASQLLSHIGAYPGVSLDHIVDEETASQIREDFKKFKAEQDDK